MSNRRRGLRDEDLTRLVHSFVLSHITLVAAFWKREGKNKLEAVIRRAYKTAIGVPQFTSTKRLYSPGIHNTLDEIAEPQRIAQLERLSRTKPGRRVLGKLQGVKTPVPYEIRSEIRVDAIPRYVHPKSYEGRRKARAKALADLHAGDAGTRYVDAAKYASRRGFAVVVDASERRPARRAVHPKRPKK